MRVRLRNVYRRLRARDLMVAALLVISLSSSVGTYALYSSSQHALHIAVEARDVLRGQRKLTDYRICRAVNKTRAISNRDRKTLIRARAETRRTLPKLPHGVLRALLLNSLRQTKRDIRDRPYLAPLRCVQVVEHPTGRLPTTTTTGG